MNTFTWVPEFSAQKDTVASVTAVKFGDGYEQRIPTGINTLPQVWNLSFANRDTSEMNAIISFLETAGGASAFYWTPPDTTTQYSFVCRKWTKVLNKANYWSISASFEQVFEP